MDAEPVADARRRNVRLKVQYDGSGFAGFQIQPDVRTVQGDMEKALRALCGAPVRITGAGRTDAGVHALGQVLNFPLPDEVPLERIVQALNRGLPPDIVVVEASEAPPEFHSRFDAVSRTYEYTILNREMRDALRARYVWHVPGTLDLVDMRRAARLFIGRRNFSAFGKPERGRSPVRDLMHLSVHRRGELVRIVCQANAFLQHMARGIAGALVDVGTRRKTVDAVRSALEQPEEAEEFTIAPPGGLCLIRVEYSS